MAEKSVGRRRVDVDRIGEGEMAVGEECAGPGDDAEAEDAGEQRVADAAGSRARRGNVGHGFQKLPLSKGPPRLDGADRRSAPRCGGRNHRMRRMLDRGCRLTTQCPPR